MAEPKLPPGWTLEDHPRWWSLEPPMGLPFGHWDVLDDAVAVAWERWSEHSGITREKWEAMERDHMALVAASDPEMTMLQARVLVDAIKAYLHGPEDEIQGTLADAILTALKIETEG